MTAYRAVIADSKDIAVVTVVCPECEAEVSLKIASARSPEFCPSCQMAYPLAVKEALAALGRFQRSAAMADEQAGKPIFRFNIKQED